MEYNENEFEEDERRERIEIALPACFIKNTEKEDLSGNMNKEDN